MFVYGAVCVALFFAFVVKRDPNETENVTVPSFPVSSYDLDPDLLAILLDERRPSSVENSASPPLMESLRTNLENSEELTHFGSTVTGFLSDKQFLRPEAIEDGSYIRNGRAVEWSSKAQLFKALEEQGIVL